MVDANCSDYELIKRDKSLCNNSVPWSEVIEKVLMSIPEPDDTVILWCHTTSPLFNSYDVALKKYLSRDKDKNDSLVAVSKVKEFILNEAGLPVNYAFGQWHKYSQYLPSYYNVAGSIFIGQLEKMINLRYVIGLSPIHHVVDEGETIDVDTEVDFEIAQFLYKRSIFPNVK